MKLNSTAVLFKDTLKAFDVFKKNKKVYEVKFFDM